MLSRIADSFSRDSGVKHCTSVLFRVLPTLRVALTIVENVLHLLISFIPWFRWLNGSHISFIITLKSSLKSQSLNLQSNPTMLERTENKSIWCYLHWISAKCQVFPNRNCSAAPSGTPGFCSCACFMRWISSSVGVSDTSFSRPSLVMRSSFMSMMISLMIKEEGKLVIAMLIWFDLCNNVDQFFTTFHQLI